MAEAKTRTPSRGGPVQLVDAIVAVVADLGATDVACMGVGVPGLVDGRTGVVRRASNLQGWHDPFDLATAVAEALDGPPVVVDNDVNLALLAEQRLGVVQGVDHVLAVFVGAGIGGALIHGGRLHPGACGLAGEMGHLVVNRGGRQCRCGGRGHLEAYAGRAAMERQARTLHEVGRPTRLVELARSRRITSSVFKAAVDEGDEVAVSLVDEAVAALGAGIASAVALLDVAAVVVGGGLAERLGPSFLSRVETAVHQDLVARDRPLRLVPAALGARGGAIGAALLAGERSGLDAAPRARHP